MAFLNNGTTVVSFAEYQDVLDADQRLFETNEGLTEDVVEQHLVRATDRIMSLLRSTAWWRSYYIGRDSTLQYNTGADVPALNINRIQARQPDFTDLCVYYALYNYILPRVADFSTEDNAERSKIGFNQQKFNLLFDELIAQGDWYDFDGTGVITSAEKSPGHVNLKRIR